MFHPDNLTSAVVYVMIPLDALLLPNFDDAFQVLIEELETVELSLSSMPLFNLRNYYIIRKLKFINKDLPFLAYTILNSFIIHGKPHKISLIDILLPFDLFQFHCIKGLMVKRVEVVILRPLFSITILFKEEVCQINCRLGLSLRMHLAEWYSPKRMCSLKCFHTSTVLIRYIHIFSLLSTVSLNKSIPSWFRSFHFLSC